MSRISYVAHTSSPGVDACVGLPQDWYGKVMQKNEPVSEMSNLTSWSTCKSHKWDLLYITYERDCGVFYLCVCIECVCARCRQVFACACAYVFGRSSAHTSICAFASITPCVRNSISLSLSKGLRTHVRSNLRPSGLFVLSRILRSDSPSFDLPEASIAACRDVEVLYFSMYVYTYNECACAHSYIHIHSYVHTHTYTQTRTKARTRA